MKSMLNRVSRPLWALPVKKAIPSARAFSPIKDRDHYLWDNWSVFHQGSWYRFALRAPKFKPCQKEILDEERHHHAHVSLYRYDHPHSIRPLSVFEPRGHDPKKFDSAMIWSGSCLSHGHDLYLFYTGVAAEPKDAHGQAHFQRIGIARYDVKTQTLIRLDEPLLCPDRSEAERLGYGLHHDPKIVMAFRDPMVELDQSQGDLHLYFAANYHKATRPDHLGADPLAYGAVGHAICKGFDLSQGFTLMPPLPLPKTYHQIELPCVKEIDGEKVLFFNSVTFAGDQRIQALRAYRFDPYGERFVPFCGDQDLFVPLEDRFGVTLTRGPQGKLWLSWFDQRSHELSPLIPLEGRNLKALQTEIYQHLYSPSFLEKKAGPPSQS